jgi:UDP-glucose 4-epimerase
MSGGKNVLVTGGAGFIGSHLVDKLLSEGWKVIVLDNLFSGSLKNIEAHFGDDRFRFVEADVRDSEALDRAVTGVDYVVHLAAVASVPLSVREPCLTHDVNSTGTLKLLKACLAHGIGRLVFASSCAVYGEPRFLPVDEGHPTLPVSPYAASKLAAERCCMVFHEAYGLGTVVLRLFNVYGVRQGMNGEGGVVFEFAERLRSGSALKVYGDGSQTRDFVCVDDVVDAFLLAMKQPAAVGEVFNVGSGVKTTVSSLAELMLGLAGSDVGVEYEEPRVGDIKHSFASIEKAGKMLGYAPRVVLQEGVGFVLRENAEDLIGR